MTLLQSITMYLALAIFSASVLLMYLKLRNKASFIFMISYILLLLLMNLEQWGMHKYIDHAIASGATADENEALAEYFDIMFIVMGTVLITFCTSFLLSVKSIAVHNYAIKGTSA
jgi:hypothetical protein